MKALYESLLDDDDEIIDKDYSEVMINAWLEDKDNCELQDPDLNQRHIYQKNNKWYVDLDTSIKIFKDIPKDLFEFWKVNGDYTIEAWIDRNKFTTLEGGPREVIGYYSCHDIRKLTSLKGAPEKVDGVFDCSSCDELLSLEGGPKIVTSNYDCARCLKLTSLKGAPKKVGGNFDCSSCFELKNLEYAPERVKGNFDCHSCRKLIELKGLPDYIGGDLLCQYCTKLTKLNGGKVIKRKLNFSYCTGLRSYMEEVYDFEKRTGKETYI